MTHRVHDYRHGRERLAIIEAQHLHALIVWAFGIQTHHRAPIDDFAAVDAKADAVLAIADRHRAHRAGGLLRGGAEFIDQLTRPLRIFCISGARMVVRGGHHNVRRWHTSFLFDPCPRQFHHVLPRPDRIERHDRRLRLTVVENEHACPQRIAHARHLTPVSDDCDACHVRRGNVDLGDADPQIGLNRKLPILVVRP